MESIDLGLITKIRLIEKGPGIKSNHRILCYNIKFLIVIFSHYSLLLLNANWFLLSIISLFLRNWKSRMFLSFWYYVLGIQHDCLITTERRVHAQYLLVIDYGCGVSFFFLIFFYSLLVVNIDFMNRIREEVLQLVFELKWGLLAFELLLSYSRLFIILLQLASNILDCF